jgi:hypothetical protein
MWQSQEEIASRWLHGCGKAKKKPSSRWLHGSGKAKNAWSSRWLRGCGKAKKRLFPVGSVDVAKPRNDHRPLGPTEVAKPRIHDHPVGFVDVAKPRKHHRPLGPTEVAKPRIHDHPVGFVDVAKPRRDRLPLAPWMWQSQDHRHLPIGLDVVNPKQKSVIFRNRQKTQELSVSFFLRVQSVPGSTQEGILTILVFRQVFRRKRYLALPLLCQCSGKKILSFATSKQTRADDT